MRAVSLRARAHSDSTLSSHARIKKPWRSAIDGSNVSLDYETAKFIAAMSPHSRKLDRRCRREEGELERIFYQSRAREL